MKDNKDKVLDVNDGGSYVNNGGVRRGIRYYESHVTIEPVVRYEGTRIERRGSGDESWKVIVPIEEDRYVELVRISNKYGYRVADLELINGEKSRKDSFVSGKDVSYDDMRLRMVGLLDELGRGGYKVWRYKIEAIVIDSRVWDEYHLVDMADSDDMTSYSCLDSRGKGGRDLLIHKDMIRDLHDIHLNDSGFRPDAMAVWYMSRGNERYMDLVDRGEYSLLRRVGTYGKREYDKNGVGSGDFVIVELKQYMDYTINERIRNELGEIAITYDVIVDASSSDVILSTWFDYFGDLAKRSKESGHTFTIMGLSESLVDTLNIVKEVSGIELNVMDGVGILYRADSQNRKNIDNRKDSVLSRIKYKTAERCLVYWDSGAIDSVFGERNKMKLSKIVELAYKYKVSDDCLMELLLFLTRRFELIGLQEYLYRNCSYLDRTEEDGKIPKRASDKTLRKIKAHRTYMVFQRCLSSKDRDKNIKLILDWLASK